MRKSVVKFNANALRSELTKNLVKEQNDRLLDYATRKIRLLGDAIMLYHSKNHMDRTGNLLNSLCWGVYYKGEMIGSGFYRDAVTMGKGKDGASISYLHEFFQNDMEDVNGRQLAEKFLTSYKPKGYGWTVFFAILAPYWGYWESGFTMKSGGGDSGIIRSAKFLQFQVMSHLFDDVRMDLSPAKTHLTVYVPKYSFRNRKYKNKKGYKKIGVMR